MVSGLARRLTVSEAPVRLTVLTVALTVTATLTLSADGETLTLAFDTGTPAELHR